MKNNKKEILKWIPSVIAALLVCVTASAKFAHVPQLVEIYSKIGLRSYLNILATAEFVFIALFMWPRTMKVGFLLLTAYFGGAMAVELSHGNLFIFPAIILTVIWIAAYLRNPVLFKSTISNKKLLFAAE